MAQIINNSRPNDPVVVDNGGGWAVAVIVLLIVLAIGAYALIRHYRPAATGGSNPSTNINVSVPNPVGGASGGSSAPDTAPNYNP